MIEKSRVLSWLCLVAVLVSCLVSVQARADFFNCTISHVSGTFSSPGAAIAAYNASRFPYSNSAVTCEGPIARLDVQYPEEQWIVKDSCVFNSSQAPTTPTGGTLYCSGSCEVNGNPHNVYGSPISGPTCIEGCEYTPSSGVGVCVDGGTYCLTPVEESGNACDVYEPPLEAPEGCSVSAGTIVCDCNANPGAPFCPGGPHDDECSDDGGIATCDPNNPGGPGGPNLPGDPSGPSNPGDSNDSGDNDGTGDGDPDSTGDGTQTPGGPGDDNSSGTGDGDTDEDGERDIDCDPFSNPDCPFTGNASSRGDCDEEPSCNGEPVQCATLKQNWRAMCYPYADDGSELAPEIAEYYDGLQTGSWADEFREEVDLSSTSLDESGYLAGSCPPTESVALPAGLGSFSISYDPFCQAATWLSFLVMFMAYFAAFRIMFGGLFA